MNHNTKKCTKCQEIFPANLEFFCKKNGGKYGLTSKCKACCSAYNKEMYKKHRKKRLESKKEYSKKNKELLKQKCKKWYYENKEYSLNERKKYAINNKEKIKNRTKKYMINKYHSDINTKIKMNISRRIRTLLFKNNKRTIDFLGCSIDELKIHLEKQFEDGMNWDNYGLYGWHIDHIRPCCSFDLTNPIHLKECFHYSNLQPLWAKENLSKGGRYEISLDSEFFE